MLFLIFSFVVSLIFILANVYIYKRLIKKLVIFKYFHKIFIVLLTLLSLIQTGFLFTRLKDLELLNNEIYTLLGMLYAPTYCLFFMSLGLDLLKLILILLGKSSKPHIILRVLFDLIFVSLGGFLTYLSVHNAIKVPEIQHTDLKIAGLKENLKIALLADIHLGKNLHEKFLESIIEKVNAENPDLLVIVGDLVDTKAKNFADYISKINNFKSHYGIFYVPGNHEYYHGIDEILETLKSKTKMHILLNENVDLGVINIAGVGDLAGLQRGIYAPDLARIKADLNSSKPSILLAHQPKTALLYDLSDFDLILSGHTHGGQVFPFMFLVKMNQGFLKGLYELSSKTKLFVTSGAGFWGPSIRTFAQSEIVILNLKAKN